jgi:hypothetical protein
MCDGDHAARDTEETPSVHTPINVVVAPTVQGEAPLALQPGESHLHLEQLQELKRKVEEEHLQLAQLYATIEGERKSHNIKAAHLRAHDVQRRICNDGRDEQLPPFAQASQNVMAIVILLRGMLEPSALEA